MNLKNLILSGTSLSTEVKSESKEMKCFVTVGGYLKYDERVWNINDYRKLHGKINESNVYYYLKHYCIPVSLLKKDMDIHTTDLINYNYVKDISNYEELEKRIIGLEKEINFNQFVPTWQSEAPL